MKKRPTPAQQQQRSDAGRKNASRFKLPPRPSGDEEDDGEDGDRYEGDRPITIPKNPDGSLKLDTIADYDRVLGKYMFSWEEAKKREVVRHQILVNESVKEEREIRRNKLLTKEQIQAREEVFDKIVLGKLESLPEFCAGLVDIDLADQVRKKAREWVAALRHHLSQEIARLENEEKAP